MNRRTLHHLAAALIAAMAIATGLPTHSTRAAGTTLVLSRNFNVFLGTTTTTGVIPVTTRGTGYAGIYYPWYQWSPDGKYLLLERVAVNALSYGDERDLLLLAPDGSVLRTLATRMPQGDFFPSWALDGDVIVYVSAQSSAAGKSQNTVSTVDVSGKATVAWRYASTEGCGGGTPVPSEQLLNQETGFGDFQPTMQWSMARHLAVYSAACVGGLNLTDTRSGTTQPFNPGAGYHAVEAALSSKGKLAVMATNAQTGARTILIDDLVSNTQGIALGSGEHPVWAPDGTVVYFVRRTATARTMHFTDSLHNKYDSLLYRSAIERADAVTLHVDTIVTRDAFGFGYPGISADGASLIFSSVDNMTSLFQHLDAHGAYTAATLKLYGPRVRIVMAATDGTVATIAMDAGRPALRP